MRNILKNLCLLCGSLVVAIALGEYVVRTAAPQKVYRFPRGLFVNDVRLQYRLSPKFHGLASTGEYRTTLRVNADGLREDRELGVKSMDTRRIMSLGDSFTMGIGVESAETFSKRLEELLVDRRVALSIEVINAGVAGYDTRQALTYLTDGGIALQPDLVLLNVYVGNDIHDNHSALPLTVVDGYLQTDTRGSGVLPTSVWAALSRSHLYQLLARFKSRAIDPSFTEKELASERAHLEIYRTDSDDRTAAIWKATFAELDRAKALSRDHGFGLVVVVIPELLQLDPAGWQRVRQSFGPGYSPDAPNRRIGDYCARQGIAVLDLLPAFASDDHLRENYFRVDGHWTPRGHRLAASTLRGFLDERQVVELRLSGHRLGS